MRFSVVDVSVQEDFKLLVTFKNNVRKIFDMKPYLDIGKYEELKDVEIFKTARIRNNAVEWINEVDIDSKFLFDFGETIE